MIVTAAAVDPAHLAAFSGAVVDPATAAGIDLTGCRIAVVVTGSQAVDLVPSLVGRAALVKVFQRDAGWVVPEVPLVGQVRHVPCLAALVGRAHLRYRIRDPEQRRQLTPRRGRVLAPRSSNAFYRAIEADNCQLISWPIARITAHGVVTADGIEHWVDTIVPA